MTSDIKPIETVYRGYRFRSRLEARWAVFFDTAGVSFEYEKQGYDVRGTWYLPDFWLPELGCWVEVKGEVPNDDYLTMLETFGRCDYPLAMFVGLPGDDRGGTAWCGLECSNSGGGCFTNDNVRWVLNESSEVCLTVGIGDSTILRADAEEWLPRLYPNREVYGSPRLEAAFAAAKQARF